jgi:hypothetical protein
MRTEIFSVIQASGEGCALCVDGAKSDSLAERIDVCREIYAYLPIHLDIDNQRPSWCPGFCANGSGVAPAVAPSMQSEQSSYAKATEDRQELFN